MTFANEIWLAIRSGSDDQSGTGAPNDPYAVHTPESFANIVGDKSKVPSNSLIRLGPGVFRTRGGGGAGVPDDFVKGKLWRALPGQKIVGARIFVTTLRFFWDYWNVPPTGLPGQQQTMIKGSVAPLQDFLSSFELSDLTLEFGRSQSKAVCIIAVCSLTASEMHSGTN